MAILAIWMWNVPHRQLCLELRLQLVAPLWKVVELLGHHWRRSVTGRGSGDLIASLSSSLAFCFQISDTRDLSLCLYPAVMNCISLNYRSITAKLLEVALCQYLATARRKVTNPSTFWFHLCFNVLRLQTACCLPRKCHDFTHYWSLPHILLLYYLTDCKGVSMYLPPTE